MGGDILIYGANGYTGRLVVERALARGLRPVLAGRNRQAVEALADETGLSSRVFDLKGRVADELGGVGTVLHLAGPFSRTSVPMLDACLAARAHYIDITGEIDVFEALAARDAEAKTAGIAVLPGAGFDVVPSDCLAAHLKRRLPGAVSLDLVIGGLNDPSRGTTRTMLEGMAAGTRVREGGIIVELPEVPRGTADFGHGLKPTLGVSWGDVSTAWHSTGIPDIRVFFEASPPLERALGIPRPLRALIASAPGRWLAGRAIDRMPPGPDADARGRGRAVLVGHAADAEGNRAVSQLETPEGYTLTALTAVEIARRVHGGEVAAGFHTPSGAFGPDFILGFSGVKRRDLS